jgi:transcriptional regulator with XRE-family HTH domain
MVEAHYGPANIAPPIAFTYRAGNINWMEQETHGQRVRRLRKAKGWTQEDLQAEAQLDQSTLSGLENRNAMPKGDSLVRLARALGTSAEYLITGAEAAPQELSKEAAQIARDFDALDDRQRAEILLLWRGLISLVQEPTAQKEDAKKAA